MPETSLKSATKPLVLTGSWAQRCDAYRRILAKSNGRVMIIFAQNSYATSFFQSVRIQTSPYLRMIPPTLVGGSPKVSSKIYPKGVSTIPQAGYADRIETTGFQPAVDHLIYEIKAFGGKKRTAELMDILRKNRQVALVGTLGDIFFPLQAGDTIIVDQPNHVGAKSQSRPFMSSRQIALVRGEVEGLRVVLGDSVISPEDLLAVKDKKFRLTTAKSTGRELTIVDRRGQKDAISPSVLSEIEQAVNSGQKILTLVMARGWASALVCRECGYIFTCQDCHRTPGVQGEKLRCCYCATEIDLPKTCPSCRSADLKPIGGGVSAIAKQLSDQFTTTKVQELSSDAPALDPKSVITVATEKIFSFPSSSFDQTFIINADRLLSGTHLDGAWRLLGYLIELQSSSSNIVVQTYFPDSIVWSSAASGNVRSFFGPELTNRRQLHLPPYGAIIAVRGTANTTEKLFAKAEKITDEILKILPTADISYPEIDDHRGDTYQGHFTIYLPKPPQPSLKIKLASLLPPSWHLDID